MSERSFEIGDIVTSLIHSGEGYIKPGDTGTVMAFHDDLLEISWHGKAGLLKSKSEYKIMDGSGWNMRESRVALVEPVSGAFTAPERSDLEDFFESV